MARDGQVKTQEKHVDTIIQGAELDGNGVQSFALACMQDDETRALQSQS